MLLYWQISSNFNHSRRKNCEKFPASVEFFRLAFFVLVLFPVVQQPASSKISKNCSFQHFCLGFISLDQSFLLCVQAKSHKHEKITCLHSPKQHFKMSDKFDGSKSTEWDFTAHKCTPQGQRSPRLKTFSHSTFKRLDLPNKYQSSLVLKKMQIHSSDKIYKIHRAH